ncbi:branched-chain amino acid ABC transporter permease [Kineosporia sp. R_H_3]|uniref:branched-chain amino acid ABC transporter permease n=1 Tax=Kineosporia sp. R_H_3 TaxID=1961848 RepID=UPI000B4AB81F|nr:branched-chain amino acid ABC transporter permease [Kineosporia sp. R_H_3]
MSVEALVNGALLGGLYALVALGLSLVFGIMRVVNLAHGIVVLAGAYAAIVVTRVVQVDPLLTFVVVGPVVFLVAALTQRLLLQRLLGHSLEAPLVATFGLLLVGQGLFTFGFGTAPLSLDAPWGRSGVTVLGLTVQAVNVVAFALAVAVVVGTQLVLTRTRFGTALRASAADPATAGTLGIDIPLMHALTFGAAAAIAALAGIVYGTAFSADPNAGLPLLVLGFTVVVMGGVGSVPGTLVGGVLVGVVSVAVGGLLGPVYSPIAVNLLLLVLLLVRPRGIARPAWLGPLRIGKAPA